MENRDLDILVQKYLEDDLTPSEVDLVAEMKSSVEWKEAVKKQESLNHALKKMAFLDTQREQLGKIEADQPKRKSYRWIIVSGMAAAILVFFYISVVQEDSQEDRVAEHTKQSMTEVEEASAADKEEEGAEDAQETSAEEVYDFKDEDITNNESVYNFKPENAAYQSLLEAVDSANTGVMSLISEKGSSDSTYVFSQEFNNNDIQKSVSYVGSTGLYAVFNVISKDERTGNVQRSIMLFDRNMNYKARYVVKSVDELARGITDKGFVLDIYREDGTITKVAYDLPKELECLDFPLWYTVCPAYY